MENPWILPLEEGGSPCEVSHSVCVRPLLFLTWKVGTLPISETGLRKQAHLWLKVAEGAQGRQVRGSHHRAQN